MDGSVECLTVKNSQSLIPRILPSGEFSFGTSLIFSPESFVKVIEDGFALPQDEVFPLRTHEYISFGYKFGKGGQCLSICFSNERDLWNIEWFT